MEEHSCNFLQMRMRNALVKLVQGITHRSQGTKLGRNELLAEICRITVRHLGAEGGQQFK